ncbi:MAG: 1-acyl-sn-glycerol-3-phosphate acyltransferase [Planctomycetota bacterium]|nr:MAG: 1-acyl-sn-glycerol-3-phosphate acyltransferase [Planctomycetota bacterium]
MLPLVWLVFRVLNRVEVEGLEHLDAVEGESVILAPNHVTAWDSWVGTCWALSSQRRFASRRHTLAVLAAPENIPTAPLRLLVACLGGIPVDRERGVEQDGLRDVVRLMRRGDPKVVLTLFPEGTRSKTGRLRRRGRPGLGWVQRQTGAPVVPIYHRGGRQMPCIGRRMSIRIGAPLRFEHLRDAPDGLDTWRAVTGEVMDALRAMESSPVRPPSPTPPRRPRRWTARRPRSERQPLWV